MKDKELSHPFNPETDISVCYCDICGKVCNTGDAFCSVKCIEEYEKEVLVAYYNRCSGYYDKDWIHCGAD